MRYRRLYGNKSRITFVRFVLPIINASKLVQYWQSSLDRRVHQVDVPAACVHVRLQELGRTRTAGRGMILRTRDTSTADITEGRKNSEGPSVSFRHSNPEAMFDQLVTTGTWDIVTNSPG